MLVIVKLLTNILLVHLYSTMGLLLKRHDKKDQLSVYGTCFVYTLSTLCYLDHMVQMTRFFDGQKISSRIWNDRSYRSNIGTIGFI